MIVCLESYVITKCKLWVWSYYNYRSDLVLMWQSLACVCNYDFVLLNGDSFTHFLSCFVRKKIWFSYDYDCFYLKEFISMFSMINKCIHHHHNHHKNIIYSSYFDHNHSLKKKQMVWYYSWVEEAEDSKFFVVVVVKIELVL